MHHAAPDSDAPVTAAVLRRCGQCGKPMRQLWLQGHYRSKVEADLCEPCTLIWFDGVESVRLAGPGVIDLVQAIHAATGQSGALSTPLSNALACQICQGPLKKVFNLSKFGRSSQLECPEGHGAYQSFMMYLAEKGYFRAYSWADIKALAAEGREPECMHCGSRLDLRPQAACPSCRFPVGMIDPSRLAGAMDVLEAAPRPEAGGLLRRQAPCPGCGAPVDAAGDLVCRHCGVVVPPCETQGAASVGEALSEQVRQNHARQTPAVSERKFLAMSVDERFINGAPESWHHGLSRQKLAIVAALGILALAIAAGALSLREFNKPLRPERGQPMPSTEPAVHHATGATSAAPDAGAVATPPATTPEVPQQTTPAGTHADPRPPSGEFAPPQLSASRVGPQLILFSRTDQPFVVRVSLAMRSNGTWVRCPLHAEASSKAEAQGLDKVRFSAFGDSRVLVPSAQCDKALVTHGRAEYEVDWLDGTPAFRSVTTPPP